MREAPPPLAPMVAGRMTPPRSPSFRPSTPVRKPSSPMGSPVLRPSIPRSGLSASTGMLPRLPRAASLGPGAHIYIPHPSAPLCTPLRTSAHLCALLNTEFLGRAITRTQPHANRNPNRIPNPNSTPAQVRELEESLAQQRRRTQQAQHRLAETEEQLRLQQMRQQQAQSPRSAGPVRSALAPAPAVLDEVRPRPRSRPHSHPG